MFFLGTNHIFETATSATTGTLNYIKSIFNLMKYEENKYNNCNV